MASSDQVVLNVGGVCFVTTHTTLCNDGDNFFSALSSTLCGHEGFVDRDPTHFRLILNYLRGSVVLPDDRLSLQELQHEASFYCLTNLFETIRQRLKSNADATTLEKSVERIARALTTRG